MSIGPSRSPARPAPGLLSIITMVLLAVVLSTAPARDRATATEAPPENRLRLDQEEAFRLERRYAAMESLATVVRTDLEQSASPDTSLLAGAWFDVCVSRVYRRMLSDTVGVHAGQRCLQLLDSSPGAPDTLRLTANQAMGWIYSHIGRSTEALQHYRSGLDVARRNPGWSPLSITGLQYELGITLINVGEFDSALAVLRPALERRKMLGAPRDAVVGDLHAGIATAYEKQGEPDLAEAEYAAAIRAHEERLGPDDPGLTVTLSRAAAFAAHADRLLLASATLNLAQVMAIDHPRIPHSCWRSRPRRSPARWSALTMVFTFRRSSCRC